MLFSKKMALVIAVILVVALTAFAGCQASPSSPASSAAASASAAPSASASEAAATTAAAASASTAATTDLANHEVYKIAATDNAFGGTVSSVYSDRSSIKKALPVTQKKNVVVGWTEPTMTSNYFTGIAQGAQEECTKYGYTLKILNANNFDATQQSSIIESLVTQKVDILVIDPADAQTQLKDAQRAVAAGIPVICSGVPFTADAPVITTVVSSNYEGGYTTGVYCADYFKNPIKEAMIIGGAGHPVSDSRLNGFLAGWIYEKQKLAGTAKSYREDAMLEAYNAYKTIISDGKLDLTDKYGINIVGMAQASWDENKGMTAAEDILTANPDISLIYSENDQMGVGVSKVVAERNLTGKVLVAGSADGLKPGLEAVRDGKMLCTGYNDPLMIAHKTVDLIHMIFEENYDANNMPIVSAIPLINITKDNYKDYYDPNSDYCKELTMDFYSIPQLNSGAASASASAATSAAASAVPSAAASAATSAS